MVERNWENIIKLVRAVEKAPASTFDLNEISTCALGSYRKAQYDGLWCDPYSEFGFEQREVKWLFFCEGFKYNGPTKGNLGKLYFYKLLRKVLGIN